MQTIGILGATGADSSRILSQYILAEFQKYNPKKSHTHPSMLIHNLPEPDVAAVMQNPEILLPSLIEGAKQLASSGATFISVPCNTAHLYIEEIRQSVSIPVVSMIEETLKEIIDLNINKVGLFATGLTVKGEVYHNLFEKNAIEIVTPQLQSQIDSVLTNLIIGKTSSHDIQVLFDTIFEMKNRAVTIVILGCTDLPIIFDQIDVQHTGLKFIDTLRLYAAAIVKYYLKSSHCSLV